MQSDAGDIFDRCFRGESKPTVVCHLGSEATTAKRVAIIGDSHAAMYLVALDQIGEDLGWSITTYTGYDCQWKPPGAGDCAAMVNRANDDFLHSATPYSVIITTATRKVSSTWSDGRIASIADMWRQTAARRTRIVALEDDPATTQDQILCVQRTTFNPASDDCSQTRSAAFAADDRLSDVVKQTEHGAVYLPTESFYCGPKECPVVIGNVLVFRDTGAHVTQTYMRTLIPNLRASLAKAANSS